MQQLTRERAEGLRKEVDAKIKEWFKQNLADDRTVQTDAVQTGEIKFNSDSVKRYLHHAATAEAKGYNLYEFEHRGEAWIRCILFSRSSPTFPKLSIGRALKSTRGISFADTIIALVYFQFTKVIIYL